MVDRLVLTSLEFGPMPFESVEKLLNDEAFVSREWFPGLSIDRVRLANSLIRLARERLVECRLDSSLEGPVVPPPDGGRIPSYWFSLTMEGEALLTHTAPWDLELAQCSLPKEQTGLQGLLRAFREDPGSWDYTVVARADDPNHMLIGWTSFLAALTNRTLGEMATHVVERTQSRPPKALHAHFRPFHSDLEFHDASRPLGEGEDITLMDLLVLDMLAVDLESPALIRDLLDHETSPYRSWTRPAGSSFREIRKAVVRLVDAGCVVAYRAEGDTLVLETSVRARLEAEALWLKATPSGIQILRSQWMSRFPRVSPRS